MKTSRIVTGALLAASLITGIATAENFFLIGKDGRISFAGSTDNVSRIAYEDNKTTLSVYNLDGDKVYSSPLAEIDYLADESPAPKADLLDIVFHEDGTAEDVSPMKNTVVRSGTDDVLTTYYNSAYGRYVARYENSWGDECTGYYRVDYDGNQAFKDAIADGHTLEAVVMANYDGLLSDASNNKECKFLASHQSGGTGLMICTKANGSAGANEFTFLPNVSTTGKSNWVWTTAGFGPEKKEYYHVVGVWNKDENKSYLYVDGELVSTTATSGNFNFASDGARWFGIGCDSAPNKATNGWKGDIVLARVYGDALSADEVGMLWDEVRFAKDMLEEELVTDVKFFSELPVHAGAVFPIFGKGFKENDRISFNPASGEGVGENCGVVLTDNGVKVAIPASVTDGAYRLILDRNGRTQDLGRAVFNVVEELPKGAKVIAHRGFWDTPGAAQNSRAAVRNAVENKFYGAEIDIWLTTDGHLMVNHDPSFNGLTIKTSTSAQCKELTLSNGEKMPELYELLDIVKGSQTKLIIEIKDHSDKALNEACATAAVKAVREAGLEDMVEYISFNLDVLKQVIAEDPAAICAYLEANMSPLALHGLGIRGIDYKIDKLRKQLSYIEEAHQLGMTVNVWTVNTLADMAEMTAAGVDFITTNAPLDAAALKDYFDENGSKETINPMSIIEPVIVSSTLSADHWQRVINLGVEHYAQYFVNEPKYENQKCQVNDEWLHVWFWAPSYTWITKLNAVIGQTNPVLNPTYNNMHQIARVWRVWIFSRLTDYFGDIPYFNATLEVDPALPAGYQAAKYDTQQSIYYDMLKELAEASAAFSDKADDVIDSKDPVFGGDVAKWRAFANSMRLRLAMRLSEVDPQKAQAEAEAAVAAAGGLVEENVSILKSRDHNPDIYGYNQFYPYPHYWSKALTMSASMEKILTNLGGIKVTKPDYRSPETNSWNPDSVPEYCDPRGMIMFDVTSPGTFASYIRHREKDPVTGKNIWVIDNDFRGRWRGVAAGLEETVAQQPNNNNVNNSRLGAFFVTGDNAYITSADAPSDAALIKAETRRQIMFYANEIFFLKAEGALCGWNMGGSAKSFYEAGIRASMASFGGRISDAEVDAYLASDMKNEYGTSVAFDDCSVTDLEGDHNSRLYKVMTQKYLASFPENGFEAWNDYRRTGMPALDPMAAPADGAVLEKGAPDWKGSLRRFTYPKVEQTKNAENYNEVVKRIGADATTTRMWWDARTSVIK